MKIKCAVFQFQCVFVLGGVREKRAFCSHPKSIAILLNPTFIRVFTSAITITFILARHAIVCMMMMISVLFDRIISFRPV